MRPLLVELRLDPAHRADEPSCLGELAALVEEDRRPVELVADLVDRRLLPRRGELALAGEDLGGALLLLLDEPVLHLLLGRTPRLGLARRGEGALRLELGEPALLVVSPDPHGGEDA